MRQAVDFRFDECCVFILIHLQMRASLVVLVVKNIPANTRDRRRGFDPWVKRFPLEQSTATHSSLLAWRIPWMEEPGGLQSTGLQRVRHD